MIPKYKIKKLLDKLVPLIKKRLKIKNKTNFHIIKNSNKKYRKMTLIKDNNHGISFVSSSGDTDICIFYDTHYSERQVIGTIIHELLHVRLHKLSGMVTMNEVKAHNEEERIVTVLEDMLISLYWDHKL